MSTSLHQPQSNMADRASRNIPQLIVRQQPRKARLCSFKEKVDRRPVDPPPIVQLIYPDQHDQSYLYDPYYFLYATLATENGEDLHFSNGTRTTVGSVVQSLHKLKDIDNRDGGFFIFSDISVRHEGLFKLKFTLFKIVDSHVHRLCSVLSETFQVYSPKTFPGMSESTFLTRCFSDQGVRIRIRKEMRSSTTGKKRRRTTDDDNTSRNTNDACNGNILATNANTMSPLGLLSPIVADRSPPPLLYATSASAGGPVSAASGPSIMSMRNLLVEDSQPSPQPPSEDPSVPFSRRLPPLVSTTTTCPSRSLPPPPTPDDTHSIMTPPQYYTQFAPSLAPRRSSSSEYQGSSRASPMDHPLLRRPS